MLKLNMEKWAIPSNNGTHDNNNAFTSSLYTHTKIPNQVPIPTTTPIVSSSFVHHQHTNIMEKDNYSISINTYSLDSSTWIQEFLNGSLCESNSSNIYHHVHSNRGYDDLIYPKNVQESSFSNYLMMEHLPSWFDILMSSLPPYSSNDIQNQDCNLSGPHFHQNQIDMASVLGDLDDETMPQNCFEKNLALIYDHNLTNHPYESTKAASFSYDIKKPGANDKKCFQNVNYDIKIKGAQTIDDQSQGLSTKASFHYNNNQRLKQLKRKNQPLESRLNKKGKVRERYIKLQQLVSPFGKAHQATILFEAIRCIKFLQEKVQELSSPYLQSPTTTKNGEKAQQDLKSKGLCLVPFS